jgi:hypothetical protein
MFSFTHKFAKFAIANVRARALVAGAFLGSIATALASVPERSTYNLSMAIVMIAAGSASFVLHALHEQAASAAGAGKAQKAASVRLWVSMLGCGVLAAIWVGQLLA